MGCALQAQFTIDLTGDYSVSAAYIVKGSTVKIEMVARYCNGDVIDLTNVDQIKVEAKKRYTSVVDPIFSASLSNGKITVVNAATGRFDVDLGQADTDFVGDAKLQSLYLMQDGRLSINEMAIILFKPSFVEVS